MLLNFSGTYTDKYQLTMAQVYFCKNKQKQTAIFDYFFRTLPFHSGYAVFAGLEDLLDILQTLRFEPKEIDYLSQQGFQRPFLEYLEQFQFQGNIYAMCEGEVVFPTQPILTVEANIIEAQIIETLLLNILNFQTLIATKARRAKYVASTRKLIDFGLRRAQGPGGYYASRAAIIGGFDATSNVTAGLDYHIPTSGTMAHSFVQSYDNELAAFRDFADTWPNHCFLLVDTYNTLESGLPNAITVAKEMEKKGNRLLGIRLDSGDLAYLATQARKMLDNAGLHYVKITASNQLDEYVIQSLLEQGAPIDTFGVGTNLVIGKPDAALDGVYKLAMLDQMPCIKLSDSLSKTTLPHRKQVYRARDAQGQFIGADVIALQEETSVPHMYHPFEVGKSLSLEAYRLEALLHPMMLKGQRLFPNKTLTEIAEYSQARLQKLPKEYQRFSNPHLYKIGLSTQLKHLRDQLIESHKGTPL